MGNNNPELSIVTTLYMSQKFVKSFYERITQSAKELTSSYEIIFVNDGSPDQSLTQIIDISKNDTHVKVIDLSRNFGHHRALMTGLSHSSGDKVFLIDVDLEEEPELLIDFWKTLANNPDCDQIYGVQNSRKGAWFERFTGAVWYMIINFLTQNHIPKNFMTIRLMSRRFVNSLVEFQERELNFATLIYLNGFQSKPIYINKGHRENSSYNLMRKMGVVINTITSSTIFPLWLIFYCGLTITTIDILFIALIIYKKLVLEVLQNGWASIMVISLFFGGMILLSLGVIGLYISKILTEVKHRPYAIIKNKINF